MKLSCKWCGNTFPHGFQHVCNPQKDVANNYLKHQKREGELAAIRQAKEALKQSSVHLQCEDGWYSCPLAENYLAEASCDCNCGADVSAKALAALNEAFPLDCSVNVAVAKKEETL